MTEIVRIVIINNALIYGHEYCAQVEYICQDNLSFKISVWAQIMINGIYVSFDKYWQNIIQ